MARNRSSLLDACRTAGLTLAPLSSRVPLSTACRWCTFTFALVLVAAVAGADVVRTSAGALDGLPPTARGVRAFKGIPYAAPPVGALRWKAPQPAASWTGTRAATTFGTNCMQLIVPERKPWSAEFMASGAIGEDCLTLNVWTAAPAGDKRPVLVWFHGGALVEGSGAIPIYDGEALAAKGVIVVTINYRLGVFGFFSHPDLTTESKRQGGGNFGFLDQIAALQWVQQNIAAFGGDPAQVTIAGQSAGAGSVHVLTASPLARGLFVRAIAESGSAVGRASRALADAEQDGARFGEIVGARSLADLRALPANTLAAPLPEGVSFRWGAVVDGYVLPFDIDTVFARGEQSDVATLTGLTSDEGSSSPTYGTLTADAFRTQLRERFGDLADEAISLYPPDSAAAQKAGARDQGLVSMHLWAARRARTAKTSVYTYYWTHALPGPDAARYAAFHTSEVPYVFNALVGGRPYSKVDHDIAERMSSYWVNFIKTGDPNGAGLPKWPAFSAASTQTMELGDSFAPRSVADASRLALYTRYFDRRIACADLVGLQLPNTLVTFAQPVNAGEFAPPGSGGKQLPSMKAMPAFCRVAATLRPSADSEIRMEAWVPASGWNGRFQAVGNGGWAGTISYPAMATALGGGYATASTDTGHTGGRASFALGHPEKVIDFGYRAVHETTVTAKAIVAKLQGRAPQHSYWNGCSTGGKQGLASAQRYPEDFDGIVAGAPANYMTRLHASQIWVAQVVHRDAESFIPAEKFEVLHRAALDKCDALDGLPDGLIANPRRCVFDPAVVQCQGADGPSCLTAAQVESARRIYAGPKNPRTGESVFPGLEPGSERGWTVLASKDPLPFGIDTYRYIVFGDPGWDWQSLDFDAGVARADAVDSGVNNAINPDLRPFFTRGGRLLLYHGWNDEHIAPRNTVNYFQRVITAVGADQVDASARLFMVPGMAHCRGGDGPDTFDAMTAMVTWVEGGTAPDRLVASQATNGTVTRTRPLCPYPQVATYTGRGSIDDAVNFVCTPADPR